MQGKILVIEDEPLVRLDIIEILESENYDVVGQGGDGEKAIELTDSLRPDLIIMDIKMPKLNGLKASEIICRRFHTPILLLTAYSQKEFIDKAKQINVLGYVVKPFSKSRLIPAVEIALQQYENQKKLRVEIDNKTKQLDDRIIIERAKGILMDLYNLTENNAYEKIRRLSMDKQVNLSDIANEIINKYS
ncbi:MAG TPA: response regulator [Bacillota bacterium]|nr:response regulator [Bacillota bacterium]